MGLLTTDVTHAIVNNAYIHNSESYMRRVDAATAALLGRPAAT